jgi:hypothetical protein
MSVSIVFIQNQSNKIEIFAQYIEVPQRQVRKIPGPAMKTFVILFRGRPGVHSELRKRRVSLEASLQFASFFKKKKK